MEYKIWEHEKVEVLEFILRTVVAFIDLCSGVN